MKRLPRVLIGGFSVLLASSLTAAPPSYRVEWLDTGQFAEPSDALPDGGFMGLAYISDNGRHVVATVQEPADLSGDPRHVGRLDLETGTAELIAEFNGRELFPLGINNEGAVVLSAELAAGANARDLFYWSPVTGPTGFGGGGFPTINGSDGEATGKLLNNFGEVLVQLANEDYVLWNWGTDSRTPIINDSAELPGSFDAVSLNDFGQVVGTVFGTPDPNEPRREDSRAFVWDAVSGMRILNDPGLMTPDLGPFSTYGRRVHASGINSAGNIVGAIRAEDGLFKGATWESETAAPELLSCAGPNVDLGSSLPSCGIWWVGSNESSIVGGQSSDESILGLYVWDETGEPYLLRNVVEGGVRCRVTSIADNGTLAGGCDGGAALLVPLDGSPQLTVASPLDGDQVEAGETLVSGTATDDGAVARVTVDDIDAELAPTGNPDDASEVSFSVPLVLPPGNHLIEIVATDDRGNTTTEQLSVVAVSADGEPPQISGLTVDPNPAAVGAVVALSADIDDLETGNSIIVGADYMIDGGEPMAMAPSDGIFDSSMETAVAQLAGFPTPGVYEICVIAEDAAGNVSAPDCTFLAVYHPTSGFVTGGGWIESPPGACIAQPEATGNANFGFVARYRRGVSIPSGNTEFQLHQPGLNFHSSSYDWLVVTGEDRIAQFKGAGTLNGAVAPDGNPYRFMLWAEDAKPDTFRIRIWWENSGTEVVIYDNGGTPLHGGSIVVHGK